MTSRYIPQLSFSFYRHRVIRADFSGGQITSDAGLLPLRAFDQRYGLTRGLAERVCDDRDDSRVSHPGLSLLRQRLYQIIAGYEDANDADRLRHDPAFLTRRQVGPNEEFTHTCAATASAAHWVGTANNADLGLHRPLLCRIAS